MRPTIVGALEPRRIHLGLVVDEVGGRAELRETSASRFEFDEFCEPITSTTSDARRDHLHGVLAVLRRVADVVARRPLDRREPLLEDRAMISFVSSTESVVWVR